MLYEFDPGHVKANTAMIEKILDTFDNVQRYGELVEEWGHLVDKFEAALSTEIEVDRKTRVLKFLRFVFNKRTPKKVEHILVSLRNTFDFFPITFTTSFISIKFHLSTDLHVRRTVIVSKTQLSTADCTF